MLSPEERRSFGKGKVVLITGASRGIGKAMCCHLALMGYTIVVTARSVQEQDTTPFPGTIMETAAMVDQLGGTALPLRCDVEDIDAIRRTVETTLERFGRIDIMINNARYEGPAHWDAMDGVDIAEMDSLYNANLRAPLHFSKLVLPHMMKQGGGMLLYSASASASRENRNLPGAGSTGLFYPSSKAGLDRAMLGLTKEVRQHNIVIFGLSPGATLTERATVVDSTFGYNLAGRHSVHVPAAVLDYLITCPEPMLFTGRVIEAPDFAREHFLMSPEDLATPFRDGEVYDPYKEPYWQRLVEPGQVEA